MASIETATATAKVVEAGLADLTGECVDGVSASLTVGGGGLGGYVGVGYVGVGYVGVGCVSDGCADFVGELG